MGKGSLWWTAAALAAAALSCRGPAKPEVVIYTAVDQVYAEPVLRDFEAANGILGRLEGSGVWVNDPRVSRRHAEFRRALDGSWTLTDLKSANGTFINGERLQETSTLKPGDRIRVAETVFLVVP